MRNDNVNDKFYQKAKALVDQMTLAECASQLRYDAGPIERLGVPAYNWWNEALHGLARSGIATMFPQAIGMAAMFSEEMVQKAGEIASTEARAKFNVYQKNGDYGIYKGLTLWSPNINIFRDPRWGRGQETYGEDPYLTSRLGVAYIKGLQGDKEHLRAAACAKHFAVHSGPEGLRHEFDAQISKKEMEETYLPAFEAAITETNCEGVMGAYNRVNGEAACASVELQKKLIEWGFDGYFTSDCWAIRDFHEHHKITNNAAESAALALNTGCDVNCGCSYINLEVAHELGLVTEEQIRQAAIRLFRTRYRLGMLGEGSEYDDLSIAAVATPENKKHSYDCAVRSMVLLKNNGILPLDEKKIKTIAVIGPNADSIAVLEGNYQGKADEYFTYLRGIRERFSGKTYFAEGSHLFKDHISHLEETGDRIAEANAIAELADVVILCIGLDGTIEGEEGDTNNDFSGDKRDLLLPKCQRLLVEAARKFNKPVVLVTSSGSAVNVGADDFVDAHIQAWYPGSEGGKALAAILFGDVSPSGKMPITFYKDTEKLPSFEEYSMKGRTYRFTEENVLYPFGYGLTYSTVEKKIVSTSDDSAVVELYNSGSTDTEDVALVFVHSDSADEVPLPRLCGFKREFIAAGEKKTVTVKLDKNAYTVVDSDGKRYKPEGKFDFSVK